MSVIVVQIGQCGNQVGYDFFSTLANELICTNKNSSKSFPDFAELCLELYFNVTKNGNEARSVLVDTEEKVINEICGSDVGKKNPWSYNQKCQIFHKMGSGNNWSQGFCSFGPKLESKFEEAVRFQVEKCDRLSGFSPIMGLAGGTGSGLGSYLMKILKDHYHKSLIINQVIWPHISGETAVQNYNTILSLAHIYQYVDSIISFHNDQLSKLCSQFNLNSSTTSMSDMNKIICKQMIHSILPSLCIGGSVASLDCLGDYAHHLTPHPDYKMTSLLMSPYVNEQSQKYTTYHWPAILKDLGQQLSYRTNSDSEWQLKFDGNLNNRRTFAHRLICRGPINDSIEMDETAVKFQYLKLKNIYQPYYPKGFCFKIHPKEIFNLQKSASLALNDKCQMSTLDNMADKAWLLFSRRAYLHQYQKFGFGKDDFEDCFIAVEHILTNYARL